MKYSIFISAILLVMMSACRQASLPRELSSSVPMPAPKNSVYYWKTVFRLDSADLNFIGEHDIGRIYLRMFDVVKEAQPVSIESRTYPNASVQVDDYLYRELSDIEITPVVYITLDALKAMSGYEGVLARNIATRVRNMCEYNELPGVAELQLDCDWTPSTEQSFFTLCDSVKAVFGELDLPWRLSSTIRLHQLARKAPPVDCGVLMVYNTGNFNDPDAANSIIHPDDVQPYVKRLRAYPLDLDVAYPTYSWQLLFRDRRFAGLLNGLELGDTTRFVQRGSNQYVALCDIPYNGRIIRTGDVVRSEMSDITDILKVKSMIESRLGNRVHSNIIYHLDSKNLSKYTSDEIDAVLLNSL